MLNSGHGRRVVRVQVGLLAERDAVHGDPALRVAAGHVITGQPDDPLDVVVHPGGDAEQPDDRVPELAGQPDDRVAGLRRARRIPRALAVEHDHVAALDRAEVIDELVDQDLVPDVERVLHRGGRDEERLHHVGLDHQHDRQREDEQEEQFRPPGEAALPPGTGHARRARTGLGATRAAGTRVTRAAARAAGLTAAVAGLGRGVTAWRRSHRPGAPWHLRLCGHCPVAVLARQFNTWRARQRRLARTPVVVHCVRA